MFVSNFLFFLFFNGSKLSKITGSKPSWKYLVRDRTIFSHNHDIIYHRNCQENGCRDNYVEETAKRISERVLDHIGKDDNIQLSKHSIEKSH